MVPHCSTTLQKKVNSVMPWNVQTCNHILLSEVWTSPQGEFWSLQKTNIHLQMTTYMTADRSTLGLRKADGLYQVLCSSSIYWSTKLGREWVQLVPALSCVLQGRANYQSGRRRIPTILLESFLNSNPLSAGSGSQENAIKCAPVTQIRCVAKNVFVHTSLLRLNCKQI